MNISELSPVEAVEYITKVTDVAELRTIATELSLTFSGNTGLDTLREKIITHIQLTPVPGTVVVTDPNGNKPVTNQVPPEEVGTPTESVNKQVQDLFGNSSDEDKDKPLLVQPRPKGPPSIPELLLMNVHDFDPSIPEERIMIRNIVRAKALRLVRVRITNLDPNDAELHGTIVTVMNKYTGKVSKFVPFGDENESGYHIPSIIVNYIRQQKFAQRRQVKGGQFGIKKYKTVMLLKYSIEILPDLSVNEIESLSKVQAASNSIDN